MRSPIPFLLLILALSVRAPAQESDPTGEDHLPYLLSAQYHRETGELDAAMEDLERGYELTQAPELLKEMGEILFAQSDFEGASEKLERAEQEIKDDPDLYRLLVMSYIGLRDERNALKWMETAREAFPGDLAVLYLAANLYDTFDETIQARYHYELLLENAPDSVAYLADYIALLGRIGEDDEALNLYERLRPLTEESPNYKAELTLGRIEDDRGNLRESLQHYTRAHMANPENPLVLVKIAQLYLDLEEPGDAQMLLEPGSMLWPYDPVIHRLLGIAYYKQAMFDEAVTEFLFAAGLDPESHQAHYYLGRSFFALQEPFRAKKHLSIALGMADRYEYYLYDAFVDIALDRIDDALYTLRRRLPEHRNDPYLHSILSHAYLQKGDPDHAESYARRAFELDPFNPNRAADLAEILLRQGDEEEALEYYELSAEGDSTALDTWFNWAMLLADRGELERADRAFEHVASRDSMDAIIFNNWGYLLADAGYQLEKAETLIQRALELDPGNAIYLDSMGWVYFQLGDLDRAEYYLRQAMETDILDPEIFTHMARILHAKGQKREALEYLDRALDLSPGDEALLELKGDLESD
jgi:tetratricopeptide (TPR) repeat protein